MIRKRRWLRRAAFSLTILVAVAGSSAGRSSATVKDARAPSACGMHVLHGSLPVWARGGFHPPTMHIAHELSADGKLVAILWANPLLSPPPKDHSNKILWVSHVSVNGSNMRIGAQRMVGSRKVGAPVVRKLAGGPGPSIINMPAAGCWRFDLSWSGHHDTIDLVYEAKP